MDPHLATVAIAAPGRLIGVAPDGDLRLVWDAATFRLPIYDLPHLAAALDEWCEEEEPPFLRRGYYRLTHSADGAIQLWLHNGGILLSREEVRTLARLVETAAQELCAPLCRQQRLPFGLGYRRLTAPPAERQWKN